jgi:hypothetical protein
LSDGLRSYEAWRRPGGIQIARENDGILIIINKALLQSNGVVNNRVAVDIHESA